MHLVEVRTRGFRNLPAVVPIAEPVAVVVGENNAGKSNLIDAMRSTLRPLHSYREQHEITIDDFATDPQSGEPTTLELAVELVFDGLDQHVRGRMLTCLSADGRALLGVRAELTDAGRVRTTMFGGDAKLDEPDLLARSAVTFTYLHPLRNAEADLRPGRSNRLVALLRALVPDADQERIVEIAQQANEELAKVGSIVSARDDIQARLDLILGLNYGQKVDLLFADPVFERVVGTMRAAVGDLAPHDLDRNGLGYNNLLYIATLLAGLEQEKDAELHLLLIEEPEAHLHCRVATASGASSFGPVGFANLCGFVFVDESAEEITTLQAIWRGSVASGRGRWAKRTPSAKCAMGSQTEAASYSWMSPPHDALQRSRRG